MMVENKDSYDVTKMLIYNVRDSDLHALVVSIKTCDGLFALAGASGIMVYGYTASVAMSDGKTLDMSIVTASDEMSFEGGFTLALRAGCHRGVVVVDGNSLYGTIMSELSIYIDTCASSKTMLALVNKMLILKLEVLKRIDVDIGDVIESGSHIFMRDKESYMCVKKGAKTLLSGNSFVMQTWTRAQTNINTCPTSSTSAPTARRWRVPSG
ncbi:hypothetical protein HBH70_226800 [Parastagonospora nodorum]|nr:hypothetical protein HBH47_220970 [Parastagonospora nodorum]KAH4150935.1 hypothetical protein HBH43_244020 [Parastagonospora nodorum]KAH4251216.1 hypothetical protein HBI03_228700 [Parastagonospora nodorum]KAH4257226.1 hypothetical protein HBI04_224450 [Parastagonospora nodorum]KAH4799866.1 hypothetical protein HBH61_220550 [Parastagonospora nodorum]